VVKKGGALIPTYVGMAVLHLLRDHFDRYVDIKFTAAMEEDLDAIARGEVDWKDFLRRFYHGADRDEGLVRRIEQEMERIGFPAIPIGTDPESGQTLLVKIGQKSVYLQLGDRNGEGGTRSVAVPDDLLIDDLTVEKAVALLEAKLKSLEPIGQDPETGKNIYVLIGPYGPYIQLGENDEDPKPKRVGLGRGTDLQTIDRPMALALLSLPRELGADPATGKPVRAGLGRFGPYVVRDRTFASVASADQLFTITLDEAMQLIHDKEAGKSRQPVLAEVGTHPQTGVELVVRKGRYGPYVTDGSVNASLPRDREPESVTVDEAVQWLVEAAERKKEGKTAGRRRKKGAKKATKKAPRSQKSKTPVDGEG
jgi:DNA topoisomerase I